jgi:hypothetical protein
MTYREIVDALAGAGFVARKTSMAGGVAALTVTVSDDGRVWSGVVIGNGEWTMGESLDEPVWEGFVSVCPESDGEYVDYPGTGVYYVECGTVADVVSAVRRAVSVLSEHDDARSCNGCGDYFDDAVSFDAHSCAVSAGE